MDEPTWSMQRRGAVAVLRYDRPPENVLGFAQLAELDALVQRVAGDEDVSVVVLTGNGRGTFVAHADIADVERLVQGDEPEGAGPDSWGITLGRLAEIPQPVVAAVDGQAWGGGLELALAAQLRVASSAAHLRFVEVAGGAIPGAGGTQRLPRLVGPGRAALMILGGEVVTAADALSSGLVEAVLPDEGFLESVLEWLGPLARQPRHSLAVAKRAMVDGAEMPLATGLAYEQRLFRGILASPQTRAMWEAPHGSDGPGADD